MKRIVTGLACFVILSQVVFSQSIYSFEGLGNLVPQGSPHNFGMGGLGIGTPTVRHINSQNPAFLVFNKLSTFQVGVEIDQRRFEGDNLSGEDTAGGLRFLSYAFPVMAGKWSSSFGITPYSTVNYNTFSEGSVIGGPEGSMQVSDNRGSGGLTNFNWSNGFFIKKKLLVGLRINYTFGAIVKESTISITGPEITASNISYEDFQSYNDWNFQIGLGYQHNLKEDKILNFGLTYSPKSALNGQRELSLIRLVNRTTIETVPVGSSDISAALPHVVGFGMSLQKPSYYKVGIDVEFQGWSNAGIEGQTYNNSFLIATGAEWIPDYDNVNSYIKRIQYTLGVSYQRLPYIVNNQTLIDFGINFGASLPVSGFSTFDLGFRWGRLGKTSNGLIQETYYKIVLGATINDRWFIKRKYD